MPIKNHVTKETILRAAVDITRESGVQSLNARRLAKALSCSTQPIFSNYATMEELKENVARASYEIYCAYLEKTVSSGKYPPYKASGMGYILFAKEEKELFKSLFMRKREFASILPQNREIEETFTLVQKNTGLSREDARRFHFEMWIFVHGIATMLATDFMEMDDDKIDRRLSDMYLGLRYRFGVIDKTKENLP